MSPLILCQIHASRDTALALVRITRECARDVGLPVTVKHSSRGIPVTAQPVITLHLPVDVASTQHQVWCLACQLACFCPEARVSVFVQGANAFSQPQRRLPALRRAS